MKIAIFGRLTENTDVQVLRQFFEYLRKRGIDWLVYEKYRDSLYKKSPALKSDGNIATFSTEEELKDYKFIYSFGGDGTVLETIRLLGRLGKPILGVNFGRLGYLTNVTQNDLIEATEDLLTDTYRIDERAMLAVNSDPPGLFDGYNFGTNDLTIHKSSTNEMITVHTYINGEFLNSYWGDGIIVATPTGSTAYSLSCGGPIMFPNSGTFAITPVAPHSLTVRPVVIPDNWVVSFEIKSRSGEAMVALDTRTQVVKSNIRIAVKRAPFKAKLIRVFNSKYVNTLRDRLMWGIDNRNS